MNKQSRTIFEKAREIDPLARKIIESIFDSDAEHGIYKCMSSRGISENDLAEVYLISRRKVRKIVERYNFNKYLEIDSTVKIKVINGKYRLVKGELVNQVAKYHRDNMHEYIMKGIIMSKALSDTNISTMTMEEFLEEVE
jgi:hypothetical protein